ncbi:DUF3124 domain-containing protein [Marinilabiliaceae bacterium JC017]|nr:DUF3124 domain-containing protein [Marinilabiliaceae bacterium JC017]
MKQYNRCFLSVVVIFFVLTACDSSKPANNLHFSLEATTEMDKSAFSFRELQYVPVYAEVYHIDQSKLFPLTATLSLRNTSLHDTLYIAKVDYYNTTGDLITRFLNEKAVLTLKPLESYDLVVAGDALEGGTGANFMVEWGRLGGSAELLIQAVMVSTSGQQGLSFITEGKVVERFGEEKNSTIQ